MKIGKRIAQLREDAGFTQSSLARAMSTSQSAISQIEADERNPSYEMLRQIAEALGVSVGYLVGGEVETLSPEEELYFRQFRSLSTPAKKELQDFAAYLRQKYPPPNKKASRDR